MTLNGLTQVGSILGLRTANERRRYKLTPSLIGWAQTYRISSAQVSSAVASV